MVQTHLRFQVSSLTHSVFSEPSHRPCSRYTLDFRVLANGDVVILDGTYALFHTTAPAGPLAYEPIPGLEDILERVIDSFVGEHASSGSLVVNVGRGVRCGVGVVRQAARRLHEGIIESMREGLKL